MEVYKGSRLPVVYARKLNNCTISPAVNVTVVGDRKIWIVLRTVLRTNRITVFVIV